MSCEGNDGVKQPRRTVDTMQLMSPQVVDDDAAGIAISRMSITVKEMEGQEIYTVSLTSKPRGLVKVVIKYEPSDFLLVVTPPVIAFDEFNWYQEFEVAVSVRCVSLLPPSRLILCTPLPPGSDVCHPPPCRWVPSSLRLFLCSLGRSLTTPTLRGQ